MSSIEPASTTEGTAEAKPETKRPMKTMATEGTTPIRREKMANTALETMYGVRLPNDSEYGGMIRPPKAWPSWYTKLKATSDDSAPSPYSVFARAAAEGCAKVS